MQSILLCESNLDEFSHFTEVVEIEYYPAESYYGKCLQMAQWKENLALQFQDCVLFNYENQAEI